MYKGTLNLSVHFGLADSECNPRQFVQDLRAICEILLSLLLQAHSQALFALAKTDPDYAEGWTDSARVAEEVRQDCLHAGTMEDKIAADQLVGEALTKLSSR